MSAMSFAAWAARRRSPSPAEVRAEVWSLGVRHHGEALEGARRELACHGIAPERAALLRACIRSLNRRQRVADTVR
ncbi:MAG: hypothetical protein GC203_20080 [Phenylobacterium sp.]|uniref:hypothetical protein n=1 Tax=Phenylobacterium sp. TaxID=1871053 RepID=UPI0025E6752D|nr:hypothetical protein [Phenylobacterium sp.]MBI1200164.1 hypothetical protein [Phenylobacterium sp.]